MSCMLILMSVIIFAVGLFIVAGVHDETMTYGVKIWLPTAIVVGLFAMFVFYLGCSFESCRELSLSLTYNEVLVYDYKSDVPPADLKAALDAGFRVAHSKDYRSRPHPSCPYDLYTKKYLVRDKATVADEFNRLTK